MCKADAEQRGCGRIAVYAEAVEQLVTEGVLHRLDSPELAAALTGQDASDDERAQELREQIADDRAQLEELAAMYAEREITAREWKAARDRIEARITTAEREVGRLTNTAVLAGYLGNADALRGHWADLNLNRQRAIVSAVLDHAIIHPAPRPGGPFDPGRVQPVWRL